MRVRQLAWLLAGTGALILAAITAALLANGSHIRVPAIAALVTFAAMILSYLGGIEGGLALREEAGDATARAAALCLGALPPLAAWGMLLALPSSQWQVAAAAVLLVAGWAADLWLARRGVIPRWFIVLRSAFTALACVILAIAYCLL